MDERTQEVVQHVQALIEANPLFMDTETTGLEGEICEIAVINLAGNALINTLVKPTISIPEDVIRIHGISDETVKDAPTFKELCPELERVLRDRVVLVYNVEFDKRMIINSARANQMQDFSFWWGDEDPWDRPLERLWRCAMELYAVYYGDYNSYHGNYRWQRLSNAARQCNIEYQDTHRALADAELTRQIVLHMAKRDEQQ